MYFGTQLGSLLDKLLRVTRKKASNACDRDWTKTVTPSTLDKFRLVPVEHAIVLTTTVDTSLLQNEEPNDNDEIDIRNEKSVLPIF